MTRTQIYLTEEEKSALEAMAEQRGLKQSELIREALDIFIERNESGNRLHLMRKACGIWKSRSDLPDFSKLRKELDGRLDSSTES